VDSERAVHTFVGTIYGGVAGVQAALAYDSDGVRPGKIRGRYNEPLYPP